MPRKYIKKGGHGGARPGAGRKPADDGIAQRYSEFGMLPDKYLMSILNGKDPTTGKTVSAKRRDAAAKILRPYMHRRLAPVRVDGNHQPSQRSVIDIEKLDDEELRQLEHIIAKAG